MNQTSAPLNRRRHGVGYWIGITLLGVWNVGMFALMLASDAAYDRCMANDAFMCFNLTGPIVALWLAVDAIVGLIVALAQWLRGRRDRASGAVTER